MHGVVLGFFCYSHHNHHNLTGYGPKLPPGPQGWPIIGNLFDLGSMPHRTWAELRSKYDDVLWLRLGTINTTAIQSSKAAAELFKHHDLSFTTSAITETCRARDYRLSSVALAPYGVYWPVIRKLMTMEMLVNKTASVRRRCVDDMLTWIEGEVDKAKGSAAVYMARFVFLMSFNLFGESHGA